MGAIIDNPEGEPTRIDLYGGMMLKVDDTLPKNEIHVYRDNVKVGVIHQIRIEED